MPVPLLKEMISARHFVELQVFEQIEPQGDERADLRIALLALQLAAAQGSKCTDLKKYLLPIDEKIDEARRRANRGE